MIDEFSNSYSDSNILLAENNAINREVVVALLNGFGMFVDTAKNGVQAVEMAADKSFDLILIGK